MPRLTWRRPGATPAEATPPHGAGDSEDSSRSPACARFWNYLPAALKESCMQSCLPLREPHLTSLSSFGTPCPGPSFRGVVDRTPVPAWMTMVLPLDIMA